MWRWNEREPERCEEGARLILQHTVLLSSPEALSSHLIAQHTHHTHLFGTTKQTKQNLKKAHKMHKYNRFLLINARNKTKSQKRKKFVIGKEEKKKLFTQKLTG
jgi:hypothetical protein